jgi:hypothetical protein
MRAPIAYFFLFILILHFLAPVPIAYPAVTVAGGEQRGGRIVERENVGR